VSTVRYSGRLFQVDGPAQENALLPAVVSHVAGNDELTTVNANDDDQPPTSSAGTSPTDISDRSHSMQTLVDGHA